MASAVAKHEPKSISNTDVYSLFLEISLQPLNGSDLSLSSQLSQTTFLPIPFSEKNQEIVKDQFGYCFTLYHLCQKILAQYQYWKMDQRMYFVVLTGKSILSRPPEKHHFFKLPTNFLRFSLRKIILNMNLMGSNTGNASLIHFNKYRNQLIKKSIIQR